MQTVEKLSLKSAVKNKDSCLSLCTPLCTPLLFLTSVSSLSTERNGKARGQQEFTRSVLFNTFNTCQSVSVMSSAGVQS